MSIMFNEICINVYVYICIFIICMYMYIHIYVYVCIYLYEGHTISFQTFFAGAFKIVVGS